MLTALKQVQVRAYSELGQVAQTKPIIRANSEANVAFWHLVNKSTAPEFGSCWNGGGHRSAHGLNRSAAIDPKNRTFDCYLQHKFYWSFASMPVAAPIVRCCNKQLRADGQERPHSGRVMSRYIANEQILARLYCKRQDARLAWIELGNLAERVGFILVETVLVLGIW
jgi:hypothetical protein